MDGVIAKYFANGLVSLDAINQYVLDTLQIDKKIKIILEQLDLNRQVTSLDRDFYHTWTYTWGFDDEIIDYAVEIGKSKSQHMSYINKILLNWKEQNIDTLEKAKQAKTLQTKLSQNKTCAKDDKPEFVTHSFSTEELNALFDNLDEVKLV